MTLVSIPPRKFKASRDSPLINAASPIILITSKFSFLRSRAIAKPVAPDIEVEECPASQGS